MRKIYQAHYFNPGENDETSKDYIKLVKPGGMRGKNVSVLEIRSIGRHYYCILSNEELLLIYTMIQKEKSRLERENKEKRYD